MDAYYNVQANEDSKYIGISAVIVSFLVWWRDTIWISSVSFNV